MKGSWTAFAGWRLRVLLVLAFAAIPCVRLPGAVLHGRLWAEEGTIFYHNAATMPWRQALLFPWGGYWNLAADAGPLLARHIAALHYVPWVTGVIGLVFQCFPAVILVCAGDAWLRRPFVRPAALLLIATAPLTEEVSLQTLHVQFHLALASALILALDVPGWRLGLFGGSILVLAPLCGPAAWLLLPLFGLRALFDRSAGRALQTAALAAGTAVQLLFFFSNEATRSHGLGPILLLCIVYIKQVVVPVFGRGIAQGESAALLQHIAMHLFPWRAVLVSLVCFALFATAVFRSRHPAALWMALAAALIGWLGFYGGLGNGLNFLYVGNSERYSFIPEVLAALALLVVAAGAGRPERWAVRAAVVWLLIVGIADTGARSPYFNEGPEWTKQVALWRMDHRRPMAIWPTGWTMSLPRE